MNGCLLSIIVRLVPRKEHIKKARLEWYSFQLDLFTAFGAFFLRKSLRNILAEAGQDHSHLRPCGTPWGGSVVALVPLTRPSALDQRIASAAQEPTGAASVYLLRSALAVVS